MSEKLQKVLASHGLGGRRTMETWIQAGRIEVNGTLAKIGDRVEETDSIKVDGRPLGKKEIKHRHLLYNKPAGEICSANDPDHKRTVFDNLPKLKKQRWISIGRLDLNTTGLLLFTTDGELANRLMHPSRQIEREYAIRVLGKVTDDQITHMKEGVLLEDGMARFTDIQKGRGEGANQWYYAVIMEGRNREVRRLWESQGLQVSRLKRVRYGNVFIPSKITSGRHMELKRDEVKGLYELVDMKPPESHRESHRDSNRDRH